MDKMSLEEFAKEHKNVQNNTSVTLNDEQLFIFTNDEEYLMQIIKPNNKEEKCTDE